MLDPRHPSCDVKERFGRGAWRGEGWASCLIRVRRTLTFWVLAFSNHLSSESQSTLRNGTMRAGRMSRSAPEVHVLAGKKEGWRAVSFGNGCPDRPFRLKAALAISDLTSRLLRNRRLGAPALCQYPTGRRTRSEVSCESERLCSPHREVGGLHHHGPRRSEDAAPE